MVVQNLLDACEREIGYLEKRDNTIDYLWDKVANAGTANFTKYGYEMYCKYRKMLNGNKNGYSWCCTWCLWIFCSVFGLETAQKMLKIPDYSLAATVNYFRDYMDAFNLVSSTPHVGDIVFFGDQHVGIVVEVSDGITTIEGNTSGGSTIVSNGGGVFKKHYYTIKSNWKFGTPDWSVVGGYDYEEPEINKDGDFELTFRVLKKGCKGDDVKAIQALLWGYGYDVGTIDGDFGSKTAKCTAQYQANHGLTADSIIGEKTLGRMLGVS